MGLLDLEATVVHSKSLAGLDEPVGVRASITLMDEYEAGNLTLDSNHELQKGQRLQWRMSLR